MKKLTALSITTAILCGLWTSLSSSLSILGWAGFAGCTAFFAAGGKFKGFKTAIFTTLSGVLWAMLSIKFSEYVEFSHIAAISTAIITFIMCIQAKIELFEFIPGTFIGSFSTFASGGNWRGVVIALVLGAILGYICESSGDLFYKITNNTIEKKVKS